jgi:hypothetical protein
MGILAETEIHSYFSTHYIQRLIDYQWHSSLKKTYYLVLICYIGAFAGVLIASNFLNSALNLVVEL